MIIFCCCCCGDLKLILFLYAHKADQLFDMVENEDNSQPVIVDPVNAVFLPLNPDGDVDLVAANDLIIPPNDLPPVVTRSARTIRHTDKDIEYRRSLGLASLSELDVDEPQSYKEALRSPFRKERMEAFALE